MEQLVPGGCVGGSPSLPDGHGSCGGSTTSRQLMAIVSPMIGGLGLGFFGCLMSYTKHLKLRLGHHTKKSRCVQAIAMVGSFAFSLFSLVPLAVGAPVNTVNILRAGALLPANAFFSQLFGLRPLLRDDYLGTLVTVSGVLCFMMFVEPPGREKTRDEFLEQMRKPAPLIFNIALLSIFCGSAFYMAILRGKRRRSPSRVLALCVSVVISCSIAAMDVATKGWAAALRTGPYKDWDSKLFWACFLTQAAFFIVSKWGMIYGCSRCDVLTFVPLNIVLNIFFAVAAGMVVMGEAAQVTSAKSWCGLAASCTSVAAGILLLVSGPAHDPAHDLPARQESTEVHHTGPSDSAEVSEDEESSSDTEDLGAGCDPTTRKSQTCCNRQTWWLFTSSQAIARLNSSHISAADERSWWREQVCGVKRPAASVPVQLEGRAPSLGSESDSSEVPA